MKRFIVCVAVLVFLLAGVVSAEEKKCGCACKGKAKAVAAKKCDQAKPPAKFDQVQAAAKKAECPKAAAEKKAEGPKAP